MKRNCKTWVAVIQGKKQLLDWLGSEDHQWTTSTTTSFFAKCSQLLVKSTLYVQARVDGDC